MTYHNSDQQDHDDDQQGSDVDLFDVWLDPNWTYDWLDDPNRNCYWTLLADVYNQYPEYPYENAVKDDERILSVKDHLVEITKYR